LTEHTCLELLSSEVISSLQYCCSWLKNYRGKTSASKFTTGHSSIKFSYRIRVGGHRSFLKMSPRPLPSRRLAKSYWARITHLQEGLGFQRTWHEHFPNEPKQFIVALTISEQTQSSDKPISALLLMGKSLWTSDFKFATGSFKLNKMGDIRDFSNCPLAQSPPTNQKRGIFNQDLSGGETQSYRCCSWVKV
jgi:hypothetical protein